MFEIVILLFPLLGIAFPIYIYIVFKLLIFRNSQLEFKRLDYFLLIILCIYLIIRSFYVTFDALFYITTYYFGFLVFYFYFHITKRKLNLYFFLKVLCIEVLIEALLINTFLPSRLLLNYPAYSEDSPHYKLFFGFFQRPYSIGSNATVTSTLILILYIFVRSNYKISLFFNLLVLGSLIVSLSGTGISLYLVYVSFLYFKPSLKSIIVFVFIVLLCYSLVQYLETSDFSKFSSLYLNQLYELKLEQIDNYLIDLNDTFQMCFGKNHKAKLDVVTFNDFSINDAFYNLGFLGLFLYLTFVISNINKVNWVMIFFFLVASFHYGAIFNIIGQFLLGYILNLSRSNLRNNISSLN